MSMEDKITALAEAAIALETSPPYSDEERDSFYEAARFLKEWGEQAFVAPDDVLAEEGSTREEAVESAQPILAISLELVRLAAGADSTVPRDVLQERVRELGQMAVTAMVLSYAEMEGIDVDPPTHPSHGESFESDGRAFY